MKTWIAAIAFCIAIRAEDISPRIGVIEVYGARKVSLKNITSALGVREGDVLPLSRENAEDRISKIPGILASRIQAECCEGRRMVLYVGVQEKDAPHFEFRPAPSGDVVLPEEIVNNYRALLDAVAASIRQHNTEEDLTNGYSLMVDSDCRELQVAFVPMLARDLAVVNQVIRQSANSEQRAIAAYVLQYGPRDVRSAKIIVDGLQYALQDPEDTVRENALRSLKTVAIGAKLHPEQEIRIEPTWFVELMNSVVWSDRHNASLALVNLTEMQDSDALDLIRQRALASVVNMARWHDLEHALPGFILAGRLAGLNENQIQTAWVAGDREAVIRRALNRKDKRLAAGAIGSLLLRQPKSQRSEQ